MAGAASLCSNEWNISEKPGNSKTIDIYVDESEKVWQQELVFKLWICDIRTASVSPVRENTIIFKDQLVDNVIVFGTVTQIVDFSTKIVFELDDCTGNINCVYVQELSDNECSLTPTNWCVPKENETSLFKPILSRAINNCFDWLQKDVNRSLRRIGKIHEEFKLGDTICVKGKINHFLNRREIRVFTLHRLDNLIDETAHIAEKVYLYTNIYDKM